MGIGQWGLAIVRVVWQRSESEDGHIAMGTETLWKLWDDFEVAVLYGIEVEQPDGILLVVGFGEHRDDRFNRLGILRKIVEHYSKLPVLMFTQCAQGFERDGGDWCAEMGCACGLHTRAG